MTLKLVVTFTSLNSGKYEDKNLLDAGKYIKVPRNSDIKFQNFSITSLKDIFTFVSEA